MVLGRRSGDAMVRLARLQTDWRPNGPEWLADTGPGRIDPMTTLDWDEMTWRNPPPDVQHDGSTIEVTTGPETDFWRTTSYGFVHENGHFLGAALPSERSIEVTFRAAFSHPFDQAGLMLWGSPERWIKTGVELSDGVLFASAVVTLGYSDWSVAALHDVAPDTPITVRASRSGDAVTIRYGIDGARPERLLRLAYLPPETELLAGPMCCSPSREGLVVRFDPVRVGPPDERLHDEPAQ